MISYKSFFRTLITTDNYISADLIKQYIESNKDSILSGAALNKELHRKFDRFVKAGLLYKRHDGTHTVYVRTELTKQIHKTYGTKKLLDAYELIELSKDNEFNQVLSKISSILDIDDEPSLGFYLSNFSCYRPIQLNSSEHIYKFINSFINIISS